MNKMKSLMKRQPIKKMFLISAASAIFNFFVAMDSFKKVKMCIKKTFFFGEFGSSSSQKPFTLLVCWEYLIEMFGDAIMRLCCFSFQKTFTQDMTLDLIEKAKQTYVLPIWQIVFLLLKVLIVRSLKGHMTLLHWLWISYGRNGCQNILQLTCLTHLKLQSKYWEEICKTFYSSMD